MKNFILLYILFIPFISLAQSGVILPSGIDLPKVTTLATCTANEKGRMVFNSTDNKSYYCNGLNWQEMTGGGFTLPYSGTGDTNGTLFKLSVTGGGVGISTQSTTGIGLYAKSNMTVAIKGESIDSYGVEGIGIGGGGIRGISTFTYGVYGNSSNSSGIHGIGFNGVSGHSNNSEGYGIYGSGVNGNAGYFSGDVIISENLKVSENKGIIQNSSSTQLKYYTGKVIFSTTLGAFSTTISDEIAIATFSANPVIYIGNIESQSGDYYKIHLSIVSVTNNSIRIRLYNASNTESTFSATWNIIGIGPK